MPAKKKRSCAFSSPYGGREIYKSGKPFIVITPSKGHSDWVGVDALSKKILRLLCKS